VGFASLIIDVRARIHFFSIKKEHQGQGLGSHFLKQLLFLVMPVTKNKLIFTIIEERAKVYAHFLEKNGFILE